MAPDAFDSAVEQSDRFAIFQENWDTFTVFIACSTQWRREMPAMGGDWYWHGLRYTECEAVIRNFGFSGKKAQGIFRDLQVMEQAAMTVLNKQGK